MATTPMSRVVGHLRRVALLQEADRLTDSQLLESFLIGQEDTAFEALVRRHGPMILGVCRRVLNDRHDAEDAFQATFLVLLRKAASIGKRELVANWLHGVAYRTALKARKATVRRRAKERQVEDMPQKQVAREDAIQDMLPLLDQELTRLPDKYRVPIILCDLEGKTRKAAAKQLAVPEKTLSTRLERARTMLAKRLSRHGPAPSGSAVAIAVSQNMASASVPPSLVSSTVKIGALVVAGKIGPAAAISAKVAALTDGVVKGMFLTKLKTMAAVLVVVGTVGSGSTLLSEQILNGQESQVGDAGCSQRTLKAVSSKPAARATEEKDLLKLVKEATRAASETSGKGEGTYVASWVQSPVATIKGRIITAFSKGHYRLQINHETRLRELDKTTIVYDGSNVFSAEFSPRIMPLEAQGEVFDPGPGGRPATCFFWNVARLLSEVTDFDEVEKLIAPQKIAVQEKGKGLIECKYMLGNSTVIITASSEAGYNITQCQVMVPGKDYPLQEQKLKWKKANGVWYIVSFLEEFRGSKNGGGLLSRRHLNYDSFEPNVVVSPENFKIKAADLPDSARILDKRKNAPQREYYYYSRLASSDEVDNIEKSLKQMPANRLQP
jgi:RNA polymerase sigma factor (sigma-70 family)